MVLESNPNISDPVKKIALTIFLFFSFTLHTFVFGFAQRPESFLSKEFNLHPLILKGIFYFFAVGVSCLHQPLSKWLGLKKTLISGLWCNVLGLSFLLIHQKWNNPWRDLLLFPAVMVLGASLLSVLNCLITFIVLEHPKRTAIAVTSLFLFGNLGVLLSPLAIRLMLKVGLETEIFFILISILLIFMFLTQAIFVEPPYPKHLHHLRSGTLIWREMHRRLILFMFALIFYSVSESTFNFWGGAFAESLMPLDSAEIAISMYWLAMITGQLIALIPLFYFDASKVIYYLIVVAIVASIWLPLQTKTFDIFMWMTVAGLGCAAIFPIILSLLEGEVIYTSLLSGHVSYLPLIETAISFMTGTYVLGIAISDIGLLIAKNPSPRMHIFLIPIYLLVTAATLIYLSKTKGMKTGSTDSFFHKK